MEAEMAVVIDDSGIGSLHAHDEREPTHAITATPGMRTIAIKSGVLAVLSHFYGLWKECPYAFLDELCRYCDIQPVPAGSTSEDYRLKAIPFVLKGDAGIWLSRLPEGSIRTWAEFRMIFLDRFFPTSKPSAQKRELQKPDRNTTSPSSSTGIGSKGCFKHALTTNWERRKSTRFSMADSRWIAKTTSTSQHKGISQKPFLAKLSIFWRG
ncbi:hypothetical protein SASPL_137897 [Salvia splendens]|uniref:Retrotransposon gag domain-containing protein n=1 Tax=Salvia splendens TaxID=180675 RepID=A0A8X8ZDD4_SALSN|nr:hypothetical protein SASPL_137897 [Salvia splendens]